MEFLCIIVAGILILIMCILLWGSHSGNSSLKINVARLEERNVALEREKDALGEAFDLERERMLIAQREKLQEQKAEVATIHEKFNKDFELIAARILDEKTKKFTDANRSNLDLLLHPLKENIKAFEEKVEKVYKAESDERNVLKGEISKLMELNRQIGEEAGNLTRALKADNKKQGNWGEVVLERILEASGLKEGESYTRQASHVSDTNGRMQPDVVILLPDKKHVIIDSKVSLLAYERLVNCETDEERKIHLKDHLVSVRNHIGGLGSKNYQDLYGISSPDFVLLFVPIESSFAIAVQNDLELFDFAWNRKVVIVTPSTLLATLRTIASIWKQEQQTQNALEIAVKAGALYDKFVGFTEDMKSIGSSLDNAKKHYSNAFNKLSTGEGNLVRKVEALEILGARVKKRIEKKLLDE